MAKFILTKHFSEINGNIKALNYHYYLKHKCEICHENQIILISNKFVIKDF